MQAKGIEEMMELLTQEGVNVVGTTDEFYSSENHNIGIWVAADSTPELFDYWSSEYRDTFGVKPSLSKLVEDNGWYFEWYDPGTMMVWVS